METEDRSATKRGGKKKDGTLKQKTVIMLAAAESCLPQVFPISAARQLMKGPNFPTQFIEQGRRANSHQLGSCFPGRFPAAVPGQANKTTHSGAGTNSILSSPCMSSVRKKNNVSFFFLKDWTKVYSMKSSAYCCTFGKLSPVGAL